MSPIFISQFKVSITAAPLTSINASAPRNESNPGTSCGNNLSRCEIKTRICANGSIEFSSITSSEAISCPLIARSDAPDCAIATSPLRKLVATISSMPTRKRISKGIKTRALSTLPSSLRKAMPNLCLISGFHSLHLVNSLELPLIVVRLLSKLRSQVR